MTSSNHNSLLWRLSVFAVGGCLLINSVGCGRGKQADRYSVSGTVNFNGAPVPVGRLVFTPDHPKGNKGPQGVAEIHNGDISQSERKMVGGPHWVQIQAFDGKAFEGEEMTIENGKELLPMQMVEIDLPRDDSRLAVNIKTAANQTYSIDIDVQKEQD